MNRLLLSALLLLLVTASAPAQFGGSRPKPKEVIIKAEATIVPATANRGETVTWRFTLEILPGWHTYPTQQVDPEATSYITKLKFPRRRCHVRRTRCRALQRDQEARSGPEHQGTANLRKQGGLGTEVGGLAERHTGAKTITVPVSLQVCDESGCLPNNISTKAKLTVSDDPPVPVDPNGQTGRADCGTDSRYSNRRRTLRRRIASDRRLHQSPRRLGGSDRRRRHVGTPQNTGLGAFMLTAVFWGADLARDAVRLPDDPDHRQLLPQAVGEAAHQPGAAMALVYCGTIVVVLGVGGVDAARLLPRAERQPVDELRPRRAVRRPGPEPVRHVRADAAELPDAVHRRRARARAGWSARCSWR